MNRMYIDVANLSGHIGDDDHQQAAGRNDPDNLAELPDRRPPRLHRRSVRKVRGRGRSELAKFDRSVKTEPSVMIANARSKSGSAENPSTFEGETQSEYRQQKTANSAVNQTNS